MKELLDRISSYNIFNYLLPGVLFAAVADTVTSYRFKQSDVVFGAFVYYFLGLVISRIGSLIIEPVLKKVAFVTFAPYGDFVAASQKDPKLEVLSEVNNMYRTLCSLFVAIALLKGYELLATRLPVPASLSGFLLIAALLVLFLFAYRKQTEYITKRIKAGKK
jgi:hypothetical protein